jgi:hypothetical protein
MPKYSSADDIYRELVDESKENWLYGLVSFAVIEEQRIEWMKHYETNHGTIPSQSQIIDWYEHQPHSVLVKAKGEAETALKLYASEVVAQVDEEFRSRVADGIVVREIKDSHRFWPQFCVSIAGGFVGILIFSALLGLVAFLVFHDTSPVAIGGIGRSKPEVIQK